MIAHNIHGCDPGYLENEVTDATTSPWPRTLGSGWMPNDDGDTGWSPGTPIQIRVR